MSQTDTAVGAISASPDRVFAALTDPGTLPPPKLSAMQLAIEPGSRRGGWQG